MTDHDDVRSRLRDSLTRMSERAYREASRPAAPEPRGVRVRLDRRPALVLCAGLVAFLIVIRTTLGLPGEPVPVVSVVEDGGEVIVHVTGAVVSPGVATLPAGSRVSDAVEAADGLGLEADESAVNLARVLRDGEQVYIPFLGDGEPGLVDLNRATSAELESLPGIGPVLAERIVADREENGPFSAVGDLSRVAGIGHAVVSDIEDLATV